MKTFILKEQNQVIAAIQATNDRELIERVEQAASDRYVEDFELRDTPTFEAASTGKEKSVKGYLKGVKLWLEISPVVLYDTEPTEQQAKDILTKAGYFVDSLWSEHDVRAKFKCTTEQAMEVLNHSLSNEYTVWSTHETIRTTGESLGLTEIQEDTDHPEDPVKVQFLYHKANDDVMAYFPELPQENGYFLSYSHVGQHSSCSPAYASECVPATSEQVEPLKQELNSLGYNLEIIYTHEK